MPSTTNANDTYILFELAGTTYGIKSEEVRHNEMLEQITPVPNATPFLEGVVFSRGQVIPAINLRLRFGFPREPHTMKTRLLVLQASNRSVGLIVDSAREFRVIPQQSIQPADSAISGTTSQFLLGIANLKDRMALLLNVETTLKLLETETPTEQGLVATV
jgi:purine-binding chemotaxis protein CheW